MSFGFKTDKDSNLKLDLMKIFWSLGYYVKPNVYVSAFYSTGEVRQYTDIDVLAIKFDEFLGEIKIICSAKAGKKAIIAKEIFFISGLQKYLKSNKGIVITSKYLSFESKEQARRLGITIIGKDQLEVLKQKTNFDDRTVKFLNLEAFENIQNSLLKVKEKTAPGYHFLTANFWESKAHRQTLICYQIMNFLKKDEVNFSAINNSLAWLYLISLLSYATSSLLFSLYMTPQNLILNELNMEIEGGKEIKIRLEELFETFKEALNAYSEVNECRDNVSTEDFLSTSFTNPILEPVSALAVRLLLQTSILKNISRAFDWLVYYQANEGLTSQPSKKEFDDIFIKENIDPKLGKKMMKDFIYFYGKHLNIKDELVKIYKKTPLYKNDDSLIKIKLNTE